MTVELARQEAGQGPPLVILHGLFGQARNWAGIAKGLADRRRTIALDLRNHGASPWAEEMDYPAMAADVAAAIEALPEGAAELVGHSMGGKAAMLVALQRPELVRRLVVADIAPKAYQRGSLLPYVEAMAAVDPSTAGSRKEVDAALADSVTDPGIRQFLMSNLVRGDGGGFRWTLNLAAIRAAMPALTGWPDVRGSYDGPTLFLAGEKSDYVADADLAAIREPFPQAELERVPGAGHWIHAEAPQATLDALRRFLPSD